MGPEALAQVLRPLSQRSHPDLLVGLQTSDDAAVFRVSADQAVIQTVDFFTPIVDDPYVYGGIAAANSMSDVYAMGGDVKFALNVVGFPDTLEPAVLSAILEGGADKVAEAGGVIAGGHTVTDAEPKYGLAVTGFIHPDRIWRKGGARPGDVLLLSKPIGTGIVSTALKNQAAPVEAVDAAVTTMLQLNKHASELARAFEIHACTDITGFGLLGHAYEVATRSAVQIRISAASVPLLPSALDLATSGHKPGGLGRNRRYYEQHGVQIRGEVGVDLADLLFDPQTSGGLLFSVPPMTAQAMLAAFRDAECPLFEIGDVRTGSGVTVES